MYSMKYDERAAEGAALLDRRRPGWEGDFTRKRDSGDSYRGLNAAWRRLIQARRGVSHGS
jgi:hypothetical protein